MKISSIEWLIEQYANENYGIEVGEQAKAMHKQEIIDAYRNGWREADTQKEGTDYYQEKFVNKKTFLDLVSNEVSPVHELVRKGKEEKQSCSNCKHISVKYHPECAFCKIIHSNAYHSYFKPKANEG